MEWKTPLEAIANRVRLRLVRTLAEHGPGTVSELADRAEMHPNTARAHLTQLEDAGLVEASAERERKVRGRPRKTYSLRPGWDPPADDFRGLAELLAGAVVDARLKPRTLRRIGAEWGRFLVGRPRVAEPSRTVPVTLAQLGFDARVENDCVRLVGCPCPVVAPDDPSVVCALARGAVEGVLAASGNDFRVAGATHRPAVRVCELALERGGRK